MPAGITPVHLVIVLVIALIILGPGRLPEVGSALGKSIREFRTSLTDSQEALRAEAKQAEVPTTSTVSGPQEASKPQD
jgi:sec-independent protein translocase protein TatA